MRYLILVVCCFFCSSIFCQENFDSQNTSNNWYVQMQFGYGIPFNHAVMESPLPIFDFHDATFYDNSGFAKNGYGTLGDGFKVALQFGRLFSNHVGGEIGVRYSATSNIKLSEINTPTFIGTHTVNSQWMEINPGIVLSSGFDKKFSIFSKIALSIPIFGATFSDVSVVDNEGRIATYYLPVYQKQLGIPLNENFTSQVSTVLDVNAKTRGGSSLGLITSLGGAMKISSALKLTTEFSIQTLRIRSINSEYKDFSQTSTVAGNALDLTVPTYIQEINFVDNLDQNSNNSIFNPSFSIDQAQDELRLKPDFSNISLLFGLHFSF